MLPVPAGSPDWIIHRITASTDGLGYHLHGTNLNYEEGKPGRTFSWRHDKVCNMVNPRYDYTNAVASDADSQLLLDGLKEGLRQFCDCGFDVTHDDFRCDVCLN